MEQRITNVVAGAAATLAVTEVGLGSVVHGLKIPLGGHSLSLNQGLFLTRTLRLLKSERGAYRYPLYVSSVAATLKSLSPAGQKLGPMLAISMQGLLFSGGVALAGVNLVGVSLGMVLLSLWAFLQPLFTVLLFFGAPLVEAVSFFLKKINEELGVPPAVLGYVALGLVVVKVLGAVAVGRFAWRADLRALERLEEKLWRTGRAQFPSAAPAATVGARLRLVSRDLTRPLFLASLILVALFLWFSQGPGAHTVWLALRPVAVAFVFFYAARSPAWGRLVPWLERSGAGRSFLHFLNATLLRLRGPQAGRVSAIVLAAGRSSRMGENKLLLPWEGRTVLRATLEEIAGSGCAEILLVVKDGADPAATEAAGLKVRTVVNRDFAKGLHSSLRAGIRAASPASVAYMICLGDQPLVRTTDYFLLAQALAAHPKAKLVAPRYQGQRGNPVLIRAELKAEILAHPDEDKGAAYLFQRHGSDVVYVDVSHPGVVTDLDTREEYERFRRA